MFLKGYFTLFCKGELFQFLKALHLRSSIEMLMYSGYIIGFSDMQCPYSLSVFSVSAISHCRVLHMLSQACLVFCCINRKHSFHLLLSPPGACPLSLLPGTFCTQFTLRDDRILMSLVSFI